MKYNKMMYVVFDPDFTKFGFKITEYLENKLLNLMFLFKLYTESLTEIEETVLCIKSFISLTINRLFSDQLKG